MQTSFIEQKNFTPVYQSFGFEIKLRHYFEDRFYMADNYKFSSSFHQLYFEINKWEDQKRN